MVVTKKLWNLSPSSYTHLYIKIRSLHRYFAMYIKFPQNRTDGSWNKGIVYLNKCTALIRSFKYKSRFNNALESEFITIKVKYAFSVFEFTAYWSISMIENTDIKYWVSTYSGYQNVVISHPCTLSSAPLW